MDLKISESVNARLSEYAHAAMIKRENLSTFKSEWVEKAKNYYRVLEVGYNGYHNTRIYIKTKSHIPSIICDILKENGVEFYGRECKEYRIV